MASEPAGANTARPPSNATVPNGVAEKAPMKVLPPRRSVDKNYLRVMELEKEVLELYKMLEYWKAEAKTVQEDSAETNTTLRNQVRGQRLMLAMRHIL